MAYRNPKDMIFVGFNSRVVALDRDYGDVVWQWKAPKGSGYVAVLLDGDRLIVSVNGYMYCLDACTGDQKWFNPLSGTGVGVPCLASYRGGSSGSHLLGAADELSRQNDSSPASSS
jgi:outer membrane protein assembly factor BamB